MSNQFTAYRIEMLTSEIVVMEKKLTDTINADRPFEEAKSVKTKIRMLEKELVNVHTNQRGMLSEKLMIPFMV